MATSLAKINIHLIFHVKSTSVKVREGDLPRLFAYIGGIIRSLGTTVIEVGGMPDHVHILTTLPKMMAPADFVRTIKAESSKWLKTLAPPTTLHLRGKRDTAYSPSVRRYSTPSCVTFVGRQSTIVGVRFARNIKCFSKPTELNTMNDMHLRIKLRSVTPSGFSLWWDWLQGFRSSLHPCLESHHPSGVYGAHGCVRLQGFRCRSTPA